MNGELDLYVQMANLGLSPTARALMALMLVLPDAAPTGVVAHVPARWADLAGVDVAEITAALTELEAAHLVVVDQRTAEVLVIPWWQLKSPSSSWSTRPMRATLTGVLSEELRRAALGR